MERDIRRTPKYEDVERFFLQLEQPAFGKVSGISGRFSASPDKTAVVFAGRVLEALEGKPGSRLCLLDLQTGELAEVTEGPRDSSPIWSPNANRIAFLRDIKDLGTQVHVYDVQSGTASELPTVAGSVSAIAWSPQGDRLLAIGTASGNGGVEAEVPSWMPAVDSSHELPPQRRVWVIDHEAANSVAAAACHIWEAAWLDGGHIVAIASDAPTEDAWYTASVRLLDVDTGESRVLYSGDRQLASPSCSPDGRRCTVIESVASDRGVVAGDVILLDADDQPPRKLLTNNVDVANIEWRTPDALLVAGMRGQHTVVGEYDLTRHLLFELLDTADGSSSPYPHAVPLGERRFAIQLESYDRPAEIVVRDRGESVKVHSFAHEGTRAVQRSCGTIEEVTWRSKEGLDVEGWLVRPLGKPPYPMVVIPHGGPVWAAQNWWKPVYALLASKGYALLLPNVRGSTGRGQVFTQLIRGDLGGGETFDHVSGVESMIAHGIADAGRVGVVGVSHGGFIACWLPTQSELFRAAVAISPVADWVSQHFSSIAPAHDLIFLSDQPYEIGSRHFTRSPVLFAPASRTPTLLISGGRDRITPPGQAREFFQALRENGIDTALAEYPEEGHNVRAFPALIDAWARVLDWLAHYMPAGAASS